MTRKNEAGQALIFGVVTLGLLLLGFTGLGIDIGYLRYEKRLQQTAADDAAIAGAVELRYGASGNPTAAAKNASGTNGFTDGANNVTVTVNNPPTSGPHQDANHVEVFVAEVQPTFFMRVLGINTQTVTARAVATLKTGTADSCIYTLGNPGNGIQGIKVNGTPQLIAPTCGIDDNGGWCTSGSKLDVTAGAIGVRGPAANGGSCGGGTVTPPPVYGIAPAPDPLSYLTAPCSPCITSTNLNISTNQTVNGGNYNSISITGGNVTLSGTIVVGSGGLTINGTANVTGTDLTFYITNGGSVKINGSGAVQLTAPTTGTYAGILFYQDRNDTSAARINGTSSSFFQGALYFPSALLDFSGTGGTGATFNSGASYTIIVSDALTVSGNATVDINSNYSGLPGGDPIKNAVLVE